MIATFKALASEPRVRLWLRLVVGLVVSAVCLVLVLHGVDLARVGAALSRTNFLWLVPAGLALAASIVVKALRWGLLFHPHYRPSGQALTAGILVGQMVNNALPIRLGEVARIQYLAENERVPRSFSLGTIGLEKALDSVSLFGLFIVVVPFVLLPSWIRESGLLVTIAFGLMLIGGVLLVSRRGSLRLIAEALVERLPALHRVAGSGRVTTILSSLDVLGHTGLLVQALIYSALALLAGAVINACVLLALGLDLSIPASLNVLLIGYLGGSVPAAPGRIGVFHGVTILSLQPFGYDESVMVSYSLLLYLVVIVLPTLAGLLIVGRHPFRWKDDDKDGALTEEKDDGLASSR